MDPARSLAFDDGRGRYPEEMKVRTPRGTQEAIRQAAQRNALSVSAFVRLAVGRAVSDALTADSHSEQRA